VKAKRPCADGFRWFLKHHQGASDYQPLLDSLVAAGRVNDACWLLSQFGPTDETLVLDSVDVDALVFAGALEVRGNIDVGTVLRTGGSIRAGGGICAGEAIVCGGDIRSSGGIRCDGQLSADGSVTALWGVHIDGKLVVRGNLRAAWDIACGDELAVEGECIAGQGITRAGAARCGKGVRAGGPIVGLHDIGAGHGIESGRTISCGGHLQANWGIKANGSIVAQGSIKAGESLQAADEIRAGNGYGVYAGLSVQQDLWAISAQVIARARPSRLLSGHWEGDGAP
jgi:hypothetical protein